MDNKTYVMHVVIWDWEYIIVHSERQTQIEDQIEAQSEAQSKA